VFRVDAAYYALAQIAVIIAFVAVWITARVWTGSDPHALPPNLAAIAPGASLGTPFDLPFHRGGNVAHVGWAIIPPQPQ
jgi:hypothetical protein